MRIAPAKAHALPSTLDDRRAKIRKASLTTQKKSRDSSCSLIFSVCVFIATVFAFGRSRAEAALTRIAQQAAESHITRLRDRPILTMEN
jgi:hypothetical protein